MLMSFPEWFINIEWRYIQQSVTQTGSIVVQSFTVPSWIYLVFLNVQTFSQMPRTWTQCRKWKSYARKCTHLWRNTAACSTQTNPAALLNSSSVYQLFAPSDSNVWNISSSSSWSATRPLTHFSWRCWRRLATAKPISRSEASVVAIVCCDSFICFVWFIELTMKCNLVAHMMQFCIQFCNRVKQIFCVVFPVFIVHRLMNF